MLRKALLISLITVLIQSCGDDKKGYEDKAEDGYEESDLDSQDAKRILEKLGLLYLKPNKIAILVTTGSTVVDDQYSPVVLEGLARTKRKFHYDVLSHKSGLRSTSIWDNLGKYPTAQGILNEIRRARERLNRNGTLLFYFSGHGDQVPGNSSIEELDQVLVTYNALLRDSDISAELLSFPSGCTIVTIVDACNSRTVIEWPNHDQRMPKMIHLSAAADDSHAFGDRFSGGLLTKLLIKLLAEAQINNTSYWEVAEALEKFIGPSKLKLTYSPNVSRTDLEANFFN